MVLGKFFINGIKMNANNLLLIASGLLFAVGAQSTIAFPQGGLLIDNSETVEVSKIVDNDKKNISKLKSKPDQSAQKKVSKVAFPQGGFLIDNPKPIERSKFVDSDKKYTDKQTNKSKQDLQKKKDSKKKQDLKPVIEKQEISKAESVTNRIEALSKTMQNISDEIKTLEISKKTIGGDVTPTAFDDSHRSHFYVGVGIDYSFMGMKDKVKSNKRTLQWKEQKIDYYSLVSTVFSFVKRDNDGNIMYDANGYPQYEIRENPMNDPEIQACFTDVKKYADGSIESGTLNLEKEAELKTLLKKKVDSLIGNSKDSNYQNSLMMVNFGAGGTGGDDEKFFRYSNVHLGANPYNANNPESFYFGTATTPHDKLEYADGIGDLANLKWNNLIFTDYQTPGDDENKGQHVTFTQILGAIAEQTFEGSATITEAGQKGMYTNLYSQRHKENGSDAFVKTIELSEINEHVKTHKPVFGGHAFAGWGDKSGKIYYGVEVEVGYSGAKSNVIKNNRVSVSQTDFANGSIQYANKNAVIKNPVTGKDFENGKVYDPVTGKVRPIHLSGLGRQTATPELELPDFSQAYDLEVKKTISFGITPMIGFAHMNTVYYASLGVTYNRYEAKLKPNMNVLGAYSDAIPVAYMKGYMENLKGSTFLHKYVKRANGEGGFVTADNMNEKENSITNYKMEAIYPSTIIEQNSSGEENTFSGLRMNYPHYEDGGISVVGESTSVEHPDRPWLDDKLVSGANSIQKVKKFRLGFEPGIGFRTYINTKYFIDLRYSCQFSQKLNINHDAFAAYPAHFGRSAMKHKIEITGHKIKLSFGRVI